MKLLVAVYSVLLLVHLGSVMCLYIDEICNSEIMSWNCMSILFFGYLLVEL
jgi:hypothetical protein